MRVSVPTDLAEKLIEAKIKISEPGRKSEFIVYSHENLETIMEKIKPFLG